MNAVWSDNGGMRILEPAADVLAHPTLREAQRIRPVGMPSVLQNAPTGHESSPREADQALLERMRAGDRVAFAAWVKTHQRTMHAIVWRYVRNDEDAHDVVQAAFVRAWQALPTFRADASLRTWLYRIAVNQALNHKRDHKNLPKAEIPEDTASHDPLAPERMAEAQTQGQLMAAVDKLPQKQRMVVELRVQQGLSFREVAEVLESTEDSAKANFHHAIKRLRTLLQDDGHG